MFSYRAVIRKSVPRHRRSAIQKDAGFVAGDFARAAAPC
jgi:hypothetical protein